MWLCGTRISISASRVVLELKLESWYSFTRSVDRSLSIGGGSGESDNFAFYFKTPEPVAKGVSFEQVSTFEDIRKKLYQKYSVCITFVFPSHVFFFFFFLVVAYLIF